MYLKWNSSITIRIYLLLVLHLGHKNHHFLFLFLNYHFILFILLSLVNEVYIICNCFIHNNCPLVHTKFKKFTIGWKGFTLLDPYFRNLVKQFIDFLHVSNLLIYNRSYSSYNVSIYIYYLHTFNSISKVIHMMNS